MNVLPVTFPVMLMVPTARLRLPRLVRRAGRWGRAPGTLRVTAGAVELEIGRLAKAFAPRFPLRQQGSPVVLVRCRGVPSSLQLSVIVADSESAALAILRPFAERRLRQALQAAGLTTEEVTASFNLGTRELLRRTGSAQ